GSDLATVSVPIEVAPPPLFSTTICWPQIADSLAETTRAMASVPPPGGSGTTRRTKRAGYAAGCRSPTVGANSQAYESAAKRRRSSMVASLGDRRSDGVFGESLELDWPV